MKQLVSINLTTRKAKDWAAPTLTFGEDLTLALRFSKNSEGQEVDAGVTVNSLKASVGHVDARPLGGQCALKIGPGAASGSNTTAGLAHDVSASALRAAIADVAATATYGTPRVVQADGSWLIFFGTQAEQVPLEVVHNAMWPVSFGRVSAWQVDGKWVHELRFVQAPVAFTSSHDVVLPAEPVVTRLQAGGTDGNFKWNEIQQLYIPPEFRGAYVLKRGYAKTTLLSRENGVEDIEEALQTLGPDCFKVTLPLSDRPAIEFVGDYAGAGQDLLVTIVEQAPAGDLTFTLSFDRAELASNLRRVESLSLPLHVQIIGTDENGFTGTLVALVLPVEIRRPLIFPELEEVPVIDWLVPTSPKTYTPRGANEVLTGDLWLSATQGDGEATEFAITHGWDTEDVAVFVRENVSGGAMLVPGTDFSVVVTNANVVTVTALDGAPAAGAWIVTVLGAQTVARWAAELTVTAPQVVAGSGYLALPAFMDATDERLTTLEALLPRAGAAGTSSGLEDARFELPDFGEILADAGALATETTLASQVVVVESGKAPTAPQGTELEAEIAAETERQAAAASDPDALPANVFYRAVVPGVGSVGRKAVEAERDAEGNIVVPEVPAMEAEPAAWPPRRSQNRWPYLLPAIEDATVSDVTTLPAMTSGSVWRWTGAEPVMLPGGNGRRSQVVPVNGYFGADGRAFYRVARQGATDWWHASEFERELWRVFLGADQFPDNCELRVAGELRIRLVGEFFDAAARDVPRVDAGAQFVLLCEAVPVPDGTSPWNVGAAGSPVVLGETRLVLSPVMESLRWELTARRQAGVASSSWLAYRSAQAGPGVTPSAVLRLRLAHFDVDDTSANPRGQVAVVMPQTKVEVRAL